MKKDTFKRLILDFIDKDLSHVVEREFSIPFDIDKVISLVGMRRTGKTFALYLLADKLREKLPRENIVYINFEDDRLFPLELEEMDLLIQAYYDLFPAKKGEKVYFLFDEIQNVPNWEMFVRRLHDTENCRLYITGSSSKLLGREIATSLRGRTLTYQVFPLSFREFLRFKGVTFTPFSVRSESEVRHAFQEFLWRGGFPEVVSYPEEVLRRTLKEYLDLVIYKDIVERHRITNLFIVKYLLTYLIRNQANLLSPGKIYNDFKSQGLRVSKNTIYEYIGFIEEAFVIFFVPVWASSVRKEWRNPKKVYAVDTSLKGILDTRRDVGRVYENVVFMELKRRYSRITYFKGHQEVDFFVEEAEEPLLLNVCYDFTSLETRKREIKGVMEAMKFLKLKRALILTAEHEESIGLDGKSIMVMPLWKWLVEKASR